MRFLYTLAVFALLSTSAIAQPEADQVNPELVIAGSADISVNIFNFTDPLPATFYPQDTTVSLYIGASFYTVNNDGVTGSGVVYSRPGVTSEAVVARKADGTEALGCTANGVGDTPPPSDAVNDFSGKIVMMRRGVCSFIYKAQNAMAGGAIGLVIYNGDDRKGPDPSPVGDVIGNMIGAADYTVQTTIPVVLIPNGIAQPVVNEIGAGSPVTLTIRAYDPTVAAEPTVGTTDSGLVVAGSNPFSTTTQLRVTSEFAEAVRVDVYNVRGQLVQTLFDGVVSGERVLTLSSARLASGVYFVRATGETFRSQQQVTVLR